MFLFQCLNCNLKFFKNYPSFPTGWVYSDDGYGYCYSCCVNNGYYGYAIKRMKPKGELHNGSALDLHSDGQCSIHCSPT